MTAEQLAASIKAEQFEAPDNPAGQYPLKYFDYDVFTIAPDGSPTQRRPKYCATALGASQLAQVFAATKIVLGNAINFTGLLDSWNDTKLVPYLIFTANGADSKPINAGLMLDYFVHGYPVQMCVDAVNAEIKGAFNG